jgi:hypothetical protein
MTPQDTFQRRLTWIWLALCCYLTLTAIGLFRWLGLGRHPDWLSTIPGQLLVGAWILGALVYLVAITRFRCPRCGTRVRVRDLGGLGSYRSFKPSFCQGCGLNLREDWPPLPTNQ